MVMPWCLGSRSWLFSRQRPRSCGHRIENWAWPTPGKSWESCAKKSFLARHRGQNLGGPVRVGSKSDVDVFEVGTWGKAKRSNRRIPDLILFIYGILGTTTREEPLHWAHHVRDGGAPNGAEACCSGMACAGVILGGSKWCLCFIESGSSLLVIYPRDIYVFTSNFFESGWSRGSALLN